MHCFFGVRFLLCRYLGEVTDPAMLRGVVMAILCIGGKSFTHMRTLLGRYDHDLSLSLSYDRIPQIAKY